MTHVHKPGFLKQWLDFQAKLIDIVPHDIKITGPRFIKATTDDSVHTYEATVALATDACIVTRPRFTVTNFAEQRILWQQYNVTKAEEVKDELEFQLRREAFILDQQ